MFGDVVVPRSQSAQAASASSTAPPVFGGRDHPLKQSIRAGKPRDQRVHLSVRQCGGIKWLYHPPTDPQRPARRRASIIF